jgi:hypothetical protein
MKRLIDIGAANRERQRWDAAIAAACVAHERYLEEYGSAAELLRAHLEAEESGGGSGGGWHCDRL